MTLADTLLRLGEAGLFRPLWSDAILGEVVTAIERIHPALADGGARRRVEAMNSAFEDACVEGWQPLVPGIVLTDPDDRHVVAAAQRGRADLIVTANLGDFDPQVMTALGIEVQGPDEFLMNQLDLAPDAVVNALWEQVEAARNPAITFDVLMAKLERCGCQDFPAAARRQRWRRYT